jgi:hypothetical protein
MARMEEFGGGRRRRARSVACRPRCCENRFDGCINAQSGEGYEPKMGTWVGRCGVENKKNYVLGKSAPQIVIFMIVPTFWSSYNLTGGSDVRGKVGPN